MSRISVIICTYNRAKFITSSLEHLVSQSLHASEFEIVVINNNSSDNTEALVNTFIDNNKDYDIKMIFEGQQGLSYARNRGLAEAQYEIVSYIDDDGMATPNYLEELQKAFVSESTLAGVGGKVIPIYETMEPDWYSPFLRMMVTAIDFGDKRFRCKGKKYPAGCSMTYRKSILQKTDGFNNDLKWRADDKYIYYEVLRFSKEVYYLPQLMVHHHIDAERLTDKNFDKLSGLLGSEEKLRILGKKKWAYPFKLVEFVFKYFVSIAIAAFYTLKGQYLKGKYVIRFRWLALKKFVF